MTSPVKARPPFVVRRGYVRTPVQEQTHGSESPVRARPLQSGERVRGTRDNTRRVSEKRARREIFYSFDKSLDKKERAVLGEKAHREGTAVIQLL